MRISEKRASELTKLSRATIQRFRDIPGGTKLLCPIIEEKDGLYGKVTYYYYDEVEMEKLWLIRLFFAYVSSLAIDYMLTKQEIEIFAKEIKKITGEDFKNINIRYRHNGFKVLTIVEYLEGIVENIVENRKVFEMPSDEVLTKALVEIA